MGTWSKRAPLLGILSVALIVAAFAIGGETPDADASASKVADFYDEGKQMAVAGLLAWGALFLVFFAGPLRNALRRTETAQNLTGGLSAVSFGGAVFYAVGMTVFAGIQFTLADIADNQ